MSRVRTTISPVPPWTEPARLLGTSEFDVERLASGKLSLSLSLEAQEAAYLLARLRGLGLDGEPLELACVPPLDRATTRAGRTREARARRHSTPGFERSGARATGEGRYSLTPEALALELGRMAAGAQVVDACCGSGGNTIGFARAGCTVHALELDPERLAEARHNVALYGVRDRVRLEQADARLRVPELSGDILFVDPPWGEHYDKRSTTREDLPLLAALTALDLRQFREIWAKVPSSFAVSTLAAQTAVPFYGIAEGDLHRIKFVLVRGGSAGLQRLRA